MKGVTPVKLAGDQANMSERLMGTSDSSLRYISGLMVIRGYRETPLKKPALFTLINKSTRNISRSGDR